MGDVTAEAARIAELKAELARLREELWVARRVRWAVDKLPEQVAYVDRDEVFRYVNDAYLTRYPTLTRDALIGQRVADVLPAELYDGIRHHIDRALDGHPVRYDGEAPGPDGQPRHYLATYMPDRPDGGLVRGFFALISDVSDVRALEQRLLQREKLSTLGRLAGGIAHDFNNQLASVLGFVDLALLEQRRDGPRGMLERARDSCLEARQLTGQLLAFARGGESVRRPTRLDELVAARIDFALRDASTVARIEADDGLWEVHGDAVQLGQVVDHLAFNARDAMDGEGEVQISLTNVDVLQPSEPDRAPGPYVCLTVRDSGPGIDAAVRAQMFDPFFSTKRDGTGLGLSAVFSIAHEHEGYLEVDSEPGRGAEFRIYLPATADGAPATGDRPAPPQGFVAGRGRVLVMDDEPVVRDVAFQVLRTIGYQPTVVADGAEALAAYAAADAQGDPFTAVILDLTVPAGMGGKETVAALLQRDPDACVLVSSGYSRDPVMARHEQYGFAGVIPKPYRVAELAAELQRALTARGRG